MTPTKLLIGQIFVVFSIVVLGVWSATQWAAAMLGYQPQLGQPWHVVGHVPVYRPWQLFDWWYHYDAYARHVFLACGAAIAGSLWRARQNQQVTTYGSSRWASRDEIEQAGLLGAAGVFLGRLGRDYLRHDGPEHVMAFAPTRSGKGVGLVVPTLLSWTGSAVVHDIKGENWTLTAGWRQRFSHCLLFNPTDPRSARYNPLLEVRKGADEVRDVQNIADILVDPEGALERRSHWEKTSHSLLVGAILHILYAEEDKTLVRRGRTVASIMSRRTATARRCRASEEAPVKPRHHIYLDDEISRQLDALTAKPGTSKSAIIADALRAHFRRRGMREVDDLLKVRLDRISADQRRTARDIDVLLESLPLFIRYQFSLTAQIPEPDAAARAIGNDRFERFIDQVGRHMVDAGRRPAAPVGEGAAR